MNFLLILQAIWHMIPSAIAAKATTKEHKTILSKYLNKKIPETNITIEQTIMVLVYSIIISYIQHVMYNDYTWAAKISIINYTNWLLFGILIGIGTILGLVLLQIIQPKNKIAEIILTPLIYTTSALLFTTAVYIPSFTQAGLILVTSVIVYIILNIKGIITTIKPVKT